ncbi:MAG: diguanylate cyclase [Phycisphaerae bacterium]|jgi:diguanylate cyclase (GGDEF)-like protein|nr:diguanylate cyclase [Phycisphaerae bacterium]
MKFTSPTILLLLAAVATAGIFFTDALYLRPRVFEQERAAMQSEASQTKSQVMLALAARQNTLNQVAAAMASCAESSGILAEGPDSDNRFALWARGAVSESGLDMVWLMDSKRNITSSWSRPGNSLVPKEAPSVPKDVSMGLLDLPVCGPVIFARHLLPKDPQNRELWVVTLIGASVRTSLWNTSGGELSLVKWQGALLANPEAVPIDASSHWVASKNRLSVSWLVRNPEGDIIAFFRASQPVPYIHLQAVSARRMVLIVLSMSMSLAGLVIVGAHILITGPVVRLLRRLQDVDQLESDSTDNLTRGLHGEPLMLAKKLQGAFRDLAHISKTDELTGLANRRHFEEVLNAFFHQAIRYRRPLSLVIIDVDFFKAINDAGGHLLGDELLKTVSRSILHACRQADLPARIGGDEFAILLPETTAPDAAAVAERIRRLLKTETTSSEELQLNVTLSIGVADIASKDIKAHADLVNRADKALYTAKERGRNCIVEFDAITGEPKSLSGNGASRDTLQKKLAGLDSRFKDVFLQAVQEIVDLIEQRDHYMRDHVHKVQRYVVLISREMGLPDALIQRLEISAMMHDIGMLSLPDSVLLCPDELTPEQVQAMQSHPLQAVQMMQGMEFLEQEIPAVRSHHEYFDGTGYPDGLAGAAIPLTARILAVADSFDAITSPRTFRGAKSTSEALDEIRKGSGTQFDPAVVAAFLKVAEQLGDRLVIAPRDEASPSPNLRFESDPTGPSEVVHTVHDV